jgi:hypothetical protein
MMRRGLLSDYFEGAAVKRLSAVEANPERSHQHEFAGGHLRKMFGDDDRLKFSARFIWMSDEQEAISEDGLLSWYDSRRKNPNRSPEYRLYYFDNSITAMMNEGDSFFVAPRRDGTAMVIITPQGSTIENQLAWLFGIENEAKMEFQVRTIPHDGSSRLDFAARYILDELGIDAEEPEADRLDTIIEQYGAKFPATHDFSRIARESLPNVSPMDDADAVLMAWLEREELLFRRLERHVVAERLKAGFLLQDEADVDGFIAFSLSVQNRRKSRAGYSLEHHLDALFRARGIRFARGAETENRNKPDFLFPGQSEYRSGEFPAERLTMLGAKSTCKDRWRQVLSEAQKIPHKHLLTLEPGISENQTDEMRAKQLQLVVPTSLHQTYRQKQQQWLTNVQQFLKMVQARQEQAC